MIKVSIYLENKRIAGVDLSRPDMGNPGVGGTEFNMVCMPYYFLNYYPDTVEFTYLANDVSVLPECFKLVQVDNCLDAVTISVDLKSDIFLWRPTLNEETHQVLERINEVNISAIAWAHNTPNKLILDHMTRTENLKRFITVGAEQLDVLRDQSIIFKSLTIVNGFDISTIPPKKKDEIDDDMVVYLGSLVPAKGFGILAKAWPEVLKQKPNAKLIVIGGGNLYNRRQPLGVWGVAEESFEANEIRPYLSGADGVLIESVKFLGLLGREKINYLQKACVGVVNPSGITENCPGSAVEFQAAMTPVVSAAHNGLLDTVIHGKTGLLGKDNRDLIGNIVSFLSDKEKSYEFGKKGREFVEKTYNFKDVCFQWREVFENILNHNTFDLTLKKENIFYKKKWARELQRITKTYIYTNSDENVNNEKDLEFISTLVWYLNKVKNTCVSENRTGKGVIRGIDFVIEKKQDFEERIHKLTILNNQYLTSQEQYRIKDLELSKTKDLLEKREATNKTLEKESEKLTKELKLINMKIESTEIENEKKNCVITDLKTEASIKNQEIIKLKEDLEIVNKLYHSILSSKRYRFISAIIAPLSLFRRK